MKMIKKIVIFLCTITLSFGINPRYLEELQRQYNDYLDLFNKEEGTIESFQIFLRNLDMIHEYNKNNEDEHCRMYLTQYSDTLENEYVHIKCSQ